MFKGSEVAFTVRVIVLGKKVESFHFLRLRDHVSRARMMPDQPKPVVDGYKAIDCSQVLADRNALDGGAGRC